MKLREMIETKNFTGCHASNQFGRQDMSQDIFGEYQFDEWQTINALEKTNRFVTYSIRTWLCTDTIVGIFVVCMDDEPLYITYKPYRKSDTSYYFVSDVAFARFKDIWDEHKPEEQVDYSLASSILDVDVDPTKKYTWENGPIKFQVYWESGRIHLIGNQANLRVS